MHNGQSYENIMKKAMKKAKETMNDNVGGPFGAAVIDAQGHIISVASNSVLKDHDATAHAEMNAIRDASKVLKTHDLSGCTIVTTAYPCPMCLSAIIWANIKHVVYGCRPKDAQDIGFRDDFIYEIMKHPEKSEGVITFDEQFRAQCLELFQEYKLKNKVIY